jgi:hypothetical protein
MPGGQGGKKLERVSFGWAVCDTSLFDWPFRQYPGWNGDRPSGRTLPIGLRLAVATIRLNVDCGQLLRRLAAKTQAGVWGQKLRRTCSNRGCDEDFDGGPMGEAQVFVEPTAVTVEVIELLSRRLRLLLSKFG